VNRKLGIAALAATLAVGGAAESAEKPAPAPRTCTDTISELPVIGVEQLLKKRKIGVGLSARSACYLREGQPPLPAAVLTLPEYTAPYVLRVESTITDSLVLPRIEMLAEDGTVTRVIEGSAFRRRTTVASVDIFIKPEHAHERRVLLFPDPAEIGKSEARTTLMAVGSPNYWMSGMDSTRVINQVDTGKLVVSLVGEIWEQGKK
jgi:hypothetical protein